MAYDQLCMSLDWYLIKYNKVCYEQFRYNTLKLDKLRKLKKKPIKSNKANWLVILLPFFYLSVNVYMMLYYISYDSIMLAWSQNLSILIMLNSSLILEIGRRVSWIVKTHNRSVGLTILILIVCGWNSLGTYNHLDNIWPWHW